jgi:hypothetical protein
MSELRKVWQYDTDGPAFLLERTAAGESSGIATSTRPGTTEPTCAADVVTQLGEKPSGAPRTPADHPTPERDTDPAPRDPAAAAMYAETLDDLLRARTTAGGALSEEQESAFVERLDALWWQMSDDEREQAEALE